MFHAPSNRYEYSSSAGIFNYGFNAHTGEPWAFYTKGVPWAAHWMWQKLGPGPVPNYKKTTTKPARIYIRLS